MGRRRPTLRKIIMNLNRSFMGALWLCISFFTAGYIFSADFVINFNRLLSMLVYGDAKGVVMFYYGAGYWGSLLLAVAAGALQAILPLVSKTVIVEANVGYFGAGTGWLVATTGFVIGTVFAYGVGRTLNSIVFRILKPESAQSVSGIAGTPVMTAVVFTACLLPVWQMQTVVYLAGLVKMKGRYFIAASTLGGSLAYLLKYSSA